MSRRVPFVVGLRVWHEGLEAIRERLEAHLLRLRQAASSDADATDDAGSVEPAARKVQESPADKRAASSASLAMARLPVGTLVREAFSKAAGDRAARAMWTAMSLRSPPWLSESDGVREMIELRRRLWELIDALEFDGWRPEEAVEIASGDLAETATRDLVREGVAKVDLGLNPAGGDSVAARIQSVVAPLLAKLAQEPMPIAAVPKVVGLSREDRNRIARRAGRIHRARQAATGLPAGLKAEESKRLLARADGVALTGPRDAHAVDVMVAALLAEMPWMERALAALWRPARRAAARGKGLQVAPMLLVGPPGVGKSHLARRLADLAGSPFVSLDVGASSEGFRIAGVTRGWGTACPGAPVESILTTGIGNSMVFVDEIEKGGTHHSTRGLPTSAWTALLGLLEPSTAARWTCPFYGVPVDMSHVSWMLAANSLDGLPAPLLSRVCVVRVERLTPTQLSWFSRREGKRLGLDSDAADALAQAVERAGARLDLRALLRLAQDLADRESLDLIH